MAVRDHLRTLWYATWLGWQVEANWTSTWVFIIYSLAKPVAATLTLVVMYLIVLGEVASDPAFFSFMYIGNTFYMFVGQALFGLTWVLHEDREHFQTLKNIYMAPISFYLYVVGRAVSKIIIVSVAVVITMAFGVLVLGLPLELTIVDWPMFAGAMGIGLVCVAMLGVALAGISMLTARHGAGLNEAMAGMFYLFSGVIFPLTVLPDAGRWVGMAIPFTYWLEVMRRSLVPQLEIEQISGLAAYSGMEIMLLLLVSGAFFFLVSWGIFRYADHRARKKGKLDMITTY